MGVQACSLSFIFLGSNFLRDFKSFCQRIQELIILMIDNTSRALIIIAIFVVAFFYLILLIKLLFRAALLCATSFRLFLAVTLFLLGKVGLNAFYLTVLLLNLEQNKDFDSHFWEQVNTSQVIIADGLQIVMLLELSNLYVNKYVRIRGNQRSGCQIFLTFQELLIIILTTVFIVLENCQISIPKFVFNVVMASLNVLPVIIVSGVRVHLSLKFSGSAIQDQSLDSQLQVINRSIWVLGLSRLCESCLQILTIFDQLSCLNYIQCIITQTNLQLFQQIMFFGLFIITQFLAQGIGLVTTVNKQTLSASNSKKNATLLSDHLSQESQQQILIMQDFVQIETIGLRPKGMGSVIQTRKINQSKKYALRKIKVELSKYLLEQILKEVKDQSHNVISCLSKPRSANYIDSSLLLLYNFYPSTLQIYINQNYLLQKRLQQASLLASALDLIHSKNLFHGHLCPNNIFTDGLSLKIGDLGLISLRKYMSMVQGYSNKDVYTAPQLLMAKGQVVIHPTRQADIYSFGMILYQLVTANLSYRKMNVKQLEKNIMNEGSRPKIPESIDEKLSAIIRLCWQKEPLRRPPASQIARRLNMLIQ